MTTSSSLKTAKRADLKTKVKHIPQLLCDKILKRQTGIDICKMNDGTRMTPGICNLDPPLATYQTVCERHKNVQPLNSGPTSIFSLCDSDLFLKVAAQ